MVVRGYIFCHYSLKLQELHTLLSLYYISQSNQVPKNPLQTVRATVNQQVLTHGPDLLGTVYTPPRLDDPLELDFQSLSGVTEQEAVTSRGVPDFRASK